MGEPVNLVVIERGNVELYYSHWGAPALPRNMFWGPEQAVPIIRRQDLQRPWVTPRRGDYIDAPIGRWANEDGWLDSQLAEGAALVDCDRQVLLLFGGCDLRSHVPLRRLYLELLAHVWSGWQVRWTCEGIAEIADYLEYPRNNVIYDDINGYPLWAYGDYAEEDLDLDSPPSCSLRPCEDEHGGINWDYLTTIGSTAFPGGALRFHALSADDGPGRYLIHGAALLGEAEHRPGLAKLHLDEVMDKDWNWGLLKGGFHIDIPSREVHFWTGCDVAGVPRRIIEAWPEWTVCWHQDCFESQLALTGSLLRLPLPSRESLEVQIFEYLFFEDLHGSRIDPCCRVDLPLAERMQILAHVLAEVNPGRTWQDELKRLDEWMANQEAAEQENSIVASPSDDPVADAFEVRLLEWLQSTVGTTPPRRRSRCPAMTPDQGTNVGYWELEYEGSIVELVVIKRRGVLDLPLREGIDWIVRVDEREPAPFISRLEAEFIPARRIPRRMYDDMIREQFKSTELRSDSTLAGPPHPGIPGEPR